MHRARAVSVSIAAFHCSCVSRISSFERHTWDRVSSPPSITRRSSHPSWCDQEFARGLSRSAADLFVETPAFAEGRGGADPIGALKNVGWHAAMIAQASVVQDGTPVHTRALSAGVFRR